MVVVMTGKRAMAGLPARGAALVLGGVGGAAVVSCAMFAPESGDFVPDVSEPVLSSGLIPLPQEPVSLEIYDNFAQKWKPYATATSDAQAALTDKTGKSFYQWTTRQPLPGGDMFWKMKAFSATAGGTMKTRVRATLDGGKIPLPTLDNAATENCVVTEYFMGDRLSGCMA
jgi:hypothetical protein